MLLLAFSVCGLFKWRQFEPEVILLAVGWYLRFSLSYRDVEELLAERAPAPKTEPAAQPRWPMILLRSLKGWTGVKGRSSDVSVSRRGRSVHASTDGEHAGVENIEPLRQLTL
jgi:hypothetical protein